jgi:hypothetical protein
MRSRAKRAIWALVAWLPCQWQPAAAAAVRVIRPGIGDA